MATPLFFGVAVRVESSAEGLRLFLIAQDIPPPFALVALCADDEQFFDRRTLCRLPEVCRALDEQRVFTSARRKRHAGPRGELEAHTSLNDGQISAVWLT